MGCGSTAVLILDVGELSVSHTDCCTPRERPPVHVEWEAGWAPESAWRRDNLLPLPGFEPWIIQPIA